MHYHSVALLVVLLALVSCEREPSLVYIPIERPNVTVEISVSAREATVGDRLTLHARRQYRGGWEQVKRRILPKGSCWVRHPPPEKEIEVADNIRWTVRPRGHAEFNLSPRMDRTRTVAFLAPGKYWISGISAVWCGLPVPTVPETLAVEIKEK